MTFQTVYEISKHPFPTMTVIMLLFFIFTVKCSSLQYKKCKSTENVKSGDSVMLLFCVVMCIIIFIGFVGTALEREEQQYADAYYRGDYVVAEGEITERSESKKGNISFIVKDKEFSFLRLINNPVPEEGYVRVTYVCVDDVEEVVKLEVATE